MPWGDCTGPWWTGTGEKKTGNCNSGCHRAYGRDASCGRGSGHGFGAPSRLQSKEDKRSYLEAVARDLESKLKNVRDQIERLNSIPGSIENENGRE